VAAVDKALLNSVVKTVINGACLGMSQQVYGQAASVATMRKHWKTSPVAN
jgi:hypothetical protein